MIVSMKKATIIYQSEDAGATLIILRKLGVIQVEHQNLPESREISALLERVALINSSIDVLNQVPLKEREIQPQSQISGDGMAVVGRIIEMGQRQEQLEVSSRNLIGQIKEWERWGDVNQDQVRNLADKGVYFRLYKVTVKELGSFPDDVIVKTIFTTGNVAHVVAISQRLFECDAEEVNPPEHGLSSLQARLAENTREMELIESDITRSAAYFDELLAEKERLEKEIEFQQVLAGMGKEGAISYVTGYIPFDMEEHLTDEARKNQWGLLVTEPDPEDKVPTLLRNPGWVNMIKPVLELLGLTPGYRELDISLVFLIFFCIFFGILIGDAAYGLIYIIITLLLSVWLKKKGMMNGEMRTIVSLFYLLGFCAVIWGLLTGTFFGQWGLSPLVPQLVNPAFLTTFCFFLGALHLSIAHSWRAFLKFPSITALADVGYICILWTAFFLANTLIMGEPFPDFGIWLVGTGVILVILFTNPRKAHILRGISEGMGTITLSFMNNITDVISYIRLFAVGLATLAISETTNTMASAFGTGVIAIIAGVVILIIGHGLNIVLCIISVLVHGVRLNVLEFSGHANVTWSGFKYEPFKE